MNPDSSFLGTGWAFPPSFTTDGAQVAMVSGAEDIHQSLEILLSTQPGERVMRETFGSDLGSFLFEEMDQALITSLRRHISDGILDHEPRITLDQLDVEESSHQAGLLHIHLSYTVRSTNSRFNMVYPFYLHEARTGLSS